jgi:hypothetical protein
MPGTHAQKVRWTALLLAQLAPASTVTDGLALGDADALLPELLAFEELLELLHAARPVIAARAAMPPKASLDRFLPILVLSAFIRGNSFVFCFEWKALFW